MALFKNRVKRRSLDGALGAPGERASEDSIGRILRRAREARGYDLQSVSQVLRVRFLYLDAIEKDIYDRLPGPVYALGFIRTYAEYLGLNSDHIVRRYKIDVEAPGNDDNLSFPTPKTETKVPPGVIFLVVLLVAVLSYGGWYYLTQRRDGSDPISAALPDSFSTLFNGIEETETPATLSETGGDSPRPDESQPSSEEVAEIQVEADASSQSESLIPDAEEFAEEEPISPPEEVASIEETVPPREVEEEASPAVEGAAEDTGSEEGEPAPLEAEAIGGEETSSSSSGPSTAEPESTEPSSAGLDLDDLPSAPGELEPAPTLAPQTSSSGDETASGEPGLEIGAPLSDNVVGNNGNALEIPAIPDSAGETAAAAGPAVFGSENGETRVRLVATEDCWVQVRSTEGELLLTRVLRPGESYQVPDETGITLFTGNAGGLEIYVDGQKLPLLGSTGQVKRDVLLEPDNLLGIEDSPNADDLPGTFGSVE